MKKKILSVIILSSILFLFVSCGVVPEKAAEAGYPITLVDQSGREVVLDKKPQSIVSSYYITTSALLALGLDDNITGIESNPEKRPIYKMCDASLLERTQVGSPKEFDLEVCASLHPDLVILPMRAKNMTESLEQLGIPVIIVNPESRAEILEMLQLIGKATGQEERADELVRFISEKTKLLTEKLENCEKPTVYLGGNSSFLSTASKGMYQNDLITLAGGVNVAGEIDDTYWVESSYEQILVWDPQVIALASEAKYSEEDILTDSNLQSCRAIREQEIFRIPAKIEAWDSPVPSGILGAAYLASRLHPDVISKELYEEMVEEYYETFYGFSCAENKILQ